GLDVSLARQDAQRSRGDARRDGGGGAGATLAARAMTVAGELRRRGDFETDLAAQAAARQGRWRHGVSSSLAMDPLIMTRRTRGIRGGSLPGGKKVPFVDDVEQPLGE